MHPNNASVLLVLLYLLAIVVTGIPNGYTISTVAGGGKMLSNPVGDGLDVSIACLYQPSDLYVNSQNDMFIVDTGYHRIRKVHANGTITTIAGTGSSTWNGDGLLAIQTNFNAPKAIAVGPSGDMFIADTFNHRIRRINSTSGIVSTVAGNGVAGYQGDNVMATTTALNNPYAVVVNSNNEIFIADTFNSRIRKVSTLGVITTLAGNGTHGYYGNNTLSTDSVLNYPIGIALSPTSQDVYFSEFYGNRIRKIYNNTGIIVNVAGTGTIGFGVDGAEATTSPLSNPHGLILTSNDEIYFEDYATHRVRKINTFNIITTVAGNGTQGYSGDGGPATTAQTSFPRGVFVTSTGDIYFAEYGNHKVRKVVNGTISTYVAGECLNGFFVGDGLNATDAFLLAPTSIQITSHGGDWIIADHDNSLVRNMSRGISGTLAGHRLSGYSSDGVLANTSSVYYPYDAFTTSTGETYIADTANHRIRKVDVNGIISTIAGNGTMAFSGDGGSALAAYVTGPRGVLVSSSGEVIFSDSGNHCIRKIFTNGTIATIAGVGGVAGYVTNVMATQAKLNLPHGVFLTSSGELYIADSNNNCVRKILTNGTLITIAGNGTAGFSGDNGPAISSLLKYPTRIHVSDRGEVFIADTNNHRIRKIALDGTISTIAGNGTAGFSGDGGHANSALLNSPFGIDTMSSGDIYIADTLNGRIRKISPYCNAGSVPSPDGSICIPSCFGVLANMSSLVCNGHGTCNTTDTCVCDGGWYGNGCELTCPIPGQFGSNCECSIASIRIGFGTDVTFVGSKVKINVMIDGCSVDKALTANLVIQNQVTNQFFTFNSSLLLFEYDFICNSSGVFSGYLQVFQNGSQIGKVYLSNSLQVKENDQFFEPSNVNALTVNDLTSAIAQSQSWTVLNDSVLSLFVNALSTVQRNSSNVDQSSKIVESFKVVSSFQSLLSESMVFSITHSVANISAELVDMASAEKAIVFEKTAQNVLFALSNCFDTSNVTKTEITDRILKSIVGTISKTSNETDNIAEMSSSSFTLCVKRNIQSSFIELGNTSIITPNIMNYAPSNSKISASVVVIKNPSKFLKPDGPSNITMVNDLQRLSQTLQAKNNTETINIAEVIELGFYQDGTYIALENMKTPLKIQFTIDHSVLEVINGDGVNYKVSCMFWNETLNNWDGYGCYSLFNGVNVSCYCNHTTKFSSFVEFTTETTSSESSKNVMISDIVISSVFSVMVLLILFISFLQRSQNPTKSRWILPYLSLTSLLVELLFSDVVSNAVGLPNLLKTANIVKEVATMINVIFFTLAILNYFIMSLRYIIFRYLYEIIAMCRQQNITIPSKSKWVKLFSRKMTTLIGNAVFAIVVICYFIIFIALRQAMVIDSYTYSVIMSVSVFVMVMILSLLTMIVFFVDVCLDIYYHQLSEQLEEMKKKTIHKGVWKRIKHLLVTNDTLFFRREFIFYVCAMVCFIISYGMGFEYLRLSFSNGSTNSINALNILGLVFSTLFNLLLIIAFGGFTSIVTYFQNRKKVEQQQDDEITTVLRNKTLCAVFEQYAKLEFSLENVVLWKRVDHVKSLLQNPNNSLSELKTELENWKKDHFEASSEMEVNVPHETKKLVLAAIDCLDDHQAVKVVNEAVIMLQDDLMLNIGDTFSRFSTSVDYEEIAKMMELKETINPGY